MNVMSEINSEIFNGKLLPLRSEIFNGKLQPLQSDTVETLEMKKQLKNLINENIKRQKYLDLLTKDLLKSKLEYENLKKIIQCDAQQNEIICTYNMNLIDNKMNEAYAKMDEADAKMDEANTKLNDVNSKIAEFEQMKKTNNNNNENNNTELIACSSYKYRIMKMFKC